MSVVPIHCEIDNRIYHRVRVNKDLNHLTQVRIVWCILQNAAHDEVRHVTDQERAEYDHDHLEEAVVLLRRLLQLLRLSANFAVDHGVRDNDCDQWN